MAVRRKGVWGKPERFESSGGFPQKRKERIKSRKRIEQKRALQLIKEKKITHSPPSPPYQATNLVNLPTSNTPRHVLEPLAVCKNGEGQAAKIAADFRGEGHFLQIERERCQ